MGNRRLLLNMYPNWLQSLVRVVLTGKYWQKMGSKISGALIGRIASGLRRMYHQKRKEVKEHNERIENRSKIQRVSQNQICQYILKGKSDNSKLAELYKSSPQIKEFLNVCTNFRDMINGNTYDKDIRKQIEKANATRNMALTNFAYGIEKRQGDSTGSHRCPLQ